MKKTFQAFSILEAALAILFIGILTSMIIPYWKAINLTNNITHTKFKANYIRRAIQGYVARYGHMPYAANKDGLSQENLLKGEVPYKTLGIEKKYAYDGFGKKFTYIVNYNLTARKAFKNTRQGAQILPITLPHIIYPTFKCLRFKTFCRNYAYEGRCDEKQPWVFDKLASQTRISVYDHINFEKNITLIKANKKLEINYIKIQKMRVKQRNFNLHKFYENTALAKKVYEINKNHYLKKEDLLGCDEKSENYDIIAWVLISHHSKNNINENLEVILDTNDLIFFQSRFNIAAQLKNPCTAVAVNVSEDVLFNEHLPRAVLL